MEKSISVIYEDKNILVINKSAGIPVHPDATYKSGTLIQEILKTHPEMKNVGDPSTNSGQENLRPGIVHRLDKDTSGVLIVAKNQSTFEFLKKQFKERGVKKTYLALVVGELNPPAGGKTGVINLPIGRSKTSLRRLASKKARGALREAITEYKVLESFFVQHRVLDNSKHSVLDKYTLVEVYPKTGRTHQIRVHFKAIGHPIVCDKLYMKKPACPFGLSRHFLHASSLELTLPDGSPRFGVEAGSRSRFEADLPDDLKRVLKSLKEYGKKEK